MDLFNDDFKDLILSFNKHQVRYLMIGGYAVNAHGYSRPTGDLDIWVEPTEENYDYLRSAFSEFGLPFQSIGLARFMEPTNYDVFAFGRPPVAIELLTAVKGLVFNQAFEQSVVMMISEVPTRLLRYNDLIASKKAADRNRDRDDVEQLRKIKGDDPG